MRKTSRALYLFSILSQILFTVSLFFDYFINKYLYPVLFTIDLLSFLLIIIQDLMVMKSWYSLDSHVLISSRLWLTSDRIDVCTEKITDTFLIIRCINDPFVSLQCVEINMDDILNLEPFISFDGELLLFPEFIISYRFPVFVFWSFISDILPSECVIYGWWKCKF